MLDESSSAAVLEAPVRKDRENEAKEGRTGAFENRAFDPD
jgi:hypothetical protein